IFFPIIITIVAGLIAPASLPLVGFLMFGNLMRECGVLDRLSDTAQNELVNLITILLGITIASTMTAEAFLNLQTLMIIAF
ncbi:sodium ion-translocating decarboxylase subunit beta, partial [Aerococcus urinae]